MNAPKELQDRFNMAFARIMRQTPPSLQSKWDGKIDWSEAKPYPQIQTHIIQNLPPGAKAAYVTLLNKLSRGNI